MGESSARLGQRDTTKEVASSGRHALPGRKGSADMRAVADEIETLPLQRIHCYRTMRIGQKKDNLESTPHRGDRACSVVSDFPDGIKASSRLRGTFTDTVLETDHFDVVTTSSRFRGTCFDMTYMYVLGTPFTVTDLLGGGIATSRSGLTLSMVGRHRRLITEMLGLLDVRDTSSRGFSVDVFMLPSF